MSIRQVETEVARARTEPGFHGEVDDALYRRVIAAYCKKMDKARLEFVAAGERGRAQAEKLAFEIEYLGRWQARPSTRPPPATWCGPPSPSWAPPIPRWRGGSSAR